MEDKRMKLEVLELKEIQKGQRKDGKGEWQKLSFKAKDGDGEHWFDSFSTRLFPNIVVGNTIEADVNISQREYDGNTYTDRKVTQIYVDGQPVGQKSGGGWRGKSPEELELSRKSYALSYAKDLCVADKIKLMDITKQAQVFERWMADDARTTVEPTSTAVKPTVPEKGTIAQKTATPAQENEQPMRNLGDLFRACKAFYNLTPTQVCKELGVSEKESIADIDDAWATIKAIKDN